jgi:hypothetical protein
MSKQTFIQSRRQFIKGAAYTSALSIGGLSSLAFATGSTSTMLDKETITLFNQSDKTVTLDALQPVSLEQVNGWIVVKINKASGRSSNTNTGQVISLAPGQRQSFAINTELAPILKNSGDYIVISSEFSVLNNMVPITTYDAMVA